MRQWLLIGAVSLGAIVATDLTRARPNPDLSPAALRTTLEADAGFWEMAPRPDDPHAAVPLVPVAALSNEKPSELGGEETARALAGRWAGKDLVLVIDPQHQQGHVDAGPRPVEPSRFRLLDVSGRMSVFEIGHRRFIGLLDRSGHHLTVTQPLVDGETVLAKSDG